MAKKLSEHDKELLKRIEQLDEHWANWPLIIHLANQLEDRDEYEKWNRRCITYNHLEEASIGEL